MMDLAAMQAEVVTNTVEKGWYETERSWGDEIALLHSEVSEALEAFRTYELKDATKPFPLPMPDSPIKPEGVGSELADVLIRLLDTCHRYGLVIRDYSPFVWEASFETFGAACMHLHAAITYMGDQTTQLRREDRAQLIFNRLHVMCEYYGIDLQEEYHRKHAYNLTRPHRHGGRAL